MGAIKIITRPLCLKKNREKQFQLNYKKINIFKLCVYSIKFGVKLHRP